MPGLIVAAVTPDNTPHGYNWTFAFPMLLFIVVTLILYALFSRPHRRVPATPISAVASGQQARFTGAASSSAAPDAASDEAPTGTAPAEADTAASGAAPDATEPDDTGAS